MLKDNLYLNNKISLALQEAPVDFYFVDLNNGGFLYSSDEQLVMSKNTRDRLLKENVIDDDSQTSSDTLIVSNLNDGFVYMGTIYKNLEVDKNGDVHLKYLDPICLMYVK
ncbi:hypothetical protein 8014-B2_0048 [Lactobacillus phage ATCC 8014-B2]|uniref:Uncharacterized protein n=1 Tax=Lactobacillus phage ATCC 8014-B2 TaxID=1225795 RepID=K4I4D1_9CAUD|nr:hypothetical protein HOQ89_gp098 [Lactobacillus phage ATCC 8014-B2]AFU63115.1 hypothetical protein 8014-B2_0048 [Lactobacillus phage ATCC 8014-B2]